MCCSLAQDLDLLERQKVAQISKSMSHRSYLHRKALSRMLLTVLQHFISYIPTGKQGRVGDTWEVRQILNG